MKWTVVWQAAVADRLAEAWMAATDRQSVADCANRIDQALSNDADQKGTDFAEFRVYSDHPLSAVFEISAADCVV